MSKMLIRLQYEIQHHRNQWKIIVLITCLAVAGSDLLSKPENSWAKCGDLKNVILGCNSSLGYRLNWIIKTAKSSQELLIFNGYRVSRNASSYLRVINGKPGKYDLNITTTTKAAQQYVCEEPGSMKRASAELIIIESNPKCNVTKDGELTTLTCHMLSHGNWAPAMECRNNNSGEVIGERAYNRSISSEGLSSRVIVPANQSQDPNVLYTCTTKFRIQEKPSDTTAANIPEYNYTWNFTRQSAEPHKDAGDNERETSEATVANETNMEPWVVAALVIVSVIVPFIAAVILRLIWRRKRNSKKAKVIPKDEITVLI